jgi:hydroxyacylglutathione hydrolase
MKKILRTLLILVGAMFLLIAIFFGSYIIRSRSAMKKMTPVETAQITDDVYAIKDNFVNMYLVRDGDDFLAIDAGIRKSDIKDELKKLDIDRDRIKAVLLTHSDADHAGGISLFDKAEIYMSKNEEQLINGETGRFLWFGNRINVKSYKLLDDKAITIGGITILPIPNPGHTPGSVSYKVNEKYLFTGDALRLYNGYVEPFPRFINKSAHQARKSMYRLTGLNEVQFIFTSHYGYSNNYQEAVKGFR